MGKKQRAPAPPDYSGLVAASERAADQAFQLGQEQLAWARETYANDSEIISRVVESAEQRQQINDANAAADRQRYEDVFQPLEDSMAQEAIDFATPGRINADMERAQSTVAQNFEAQRRAAVQNLESFGVDPSSTRFAALDAGSRVAQAAATAGAGNQARGQTEAIGRALRSEAVNVGRGYPGQIAGTYATALQSGNQAANSALAGTGSGASTMGTGTQWMGTGMGALNTGMQGLNMGYNNALSGAEFNSQQSSGLGSLAGAALGAAGNAGSFGALFAGLNEGGAVPAQPPGPVTSGGNVPPAASPTRGAAIDDVTAKLTAGEFVIPKEAVSWYGERHFQKLIEKSKAERQAAPAKPEYAIAPMTPPTYASSPTAIPAR